MRRERPWNSDIWDRQKQKDSQRHVKVSGAGRHLRG